MSELFQGYQGLEPINLHWWPLLACLHVTAGFLAMVRLGWFKYTKVVVLMGVGALPPVSLRECQNIRVLFFAPRARVIDLKCVGDLLLKCI